MHKFLGNDKSKHTNHAGQDTLHKVYVHKIGGPKRGEGPVRERVYKSAGQARKGMNMMKGALDHDEIASGPFETRKED